MSIQAELLWSSKASNPLVLDNQRMLIAETMFDLQTGNPSLDSGKANELKDLLKDAEFLPSYSRLSSNRKYLLLCGVSRPSEPTLVLPSVEAVVWEVDSNKPLRRISLMKASGENINGIGQSFCADVSDDGRAIVAGDDSLLAVGDVQTGAELGQSISSDVTKKKKAALQRSGFHLMGD